MIQSVTEQVEIFFLSTEMASSANFLNCPKIVVENEVKPSVKLQCVEICWRSGTPQCFPSGLWSSRRSGWGRELTALQPLLVLHRGLRGQGGGGGEGGRAVNTEETFSQYSLQPAEPGIFREDESHHLQAGLEFCSPLMLINYGK